MGFKSRRHMVDLLFTLALFCVFTASALMVVLIGAGVYQNTIEQMDKNFSTRTSITYVTTKIRQNDVENGVSVITFQGIPAILLTQTVEDAQYETWIYHYEGALRELFVPKGSPITPVDGQIIVEVPRFDISREAGAISVTVTDSAGNTTSQTITPRCKLAGELPGGGAGT